jgi:hypothetical protein
MPKDQIRKMFELHKLQQLKRSGGDEQADTEFRLQVKRRLYRLFDMQNMIQDPAERKDKLNTIFAELVQEYAITLGALQ